MSKLSPAEQLAKRRRRQRIKRNAQPKPQKRVWDTTLTRHREDLHLSMRDVATACRLSVAAYFRIEHGYADPCLSSAARIAAFFGVTVGELWRKTP